MLPQHRGLQGADFLNYAYLFCLFPFHFCTYGHFYIKTLPVITFVSCHMLLNPVKGFPCKTATERCTVYMDSLECFTRILRLKSAGAEKNSPCCMRWPCKKKLLTNKKQLAHQTPISIIVDLLLYKSDICRI